MPDLSDLLAVRDAVRRGRHRMTGHDLLLILLAAIAGGMFALAARAAWQHDRDRRWP
jgi:hypothetical protein